MRLQSCTTAKHYLFLQQLQRSASSEIKTNNMMDSERTASALYSVEPGSTGHKSEHTLHNCTVVQLHNDTNPQSHGCAETQSCNSTITQLHKDGDVQLCSCTTTQPRNQASTLLKGCAVVHLHKYTTAWLCDCKTE